MKNHLENDPTILQEFVDVLDGLVDYEEVAKELGVSFTDVVYLMNALREVLDEKEEELTPELIEELEKAIKEPATKILRIEGSAT
jgi:NTP pyrophosphatase (non-canonical NTP hydrolase)